MAPTVHPDSHHPGHSQHNLEEDGWIVAMKPSPWGCHRGHESNIKFAFDLLHLCSPELATNQVGKGTDNDLEVLNLRFNGVPLL